MSNSCSNLIQFLVNIYMLSHCSGKFLQFLTRFLRYLRLRDNRIGRKNINRNSFPASEDEASSNAGGVGAGPGKSRYQFAELAPQSPEDGCQDGCRRGFRAVG